MVMYWGREVDILGHEHASANTKTRAVNLFYDLNESNAGIAVRM